VVDWVIARAGDSSVHSCCLDIIARDPPRKVLHSQWRHRLFVPESPLFNCCCSTGDNSHFLVICSGTGGYQPGACIAMSRPSIVDRGTLLLSYRCTGVYRSVVMPISFICC
jgi:hypothetical protein